MTSSGLAAFGTSQDNLGMSVHRTHPSWPSVPKRRSRPLPRNSAPIAFPHASIRPASHVALALVPLEAETREMHAMRRNAEKRTPALLTHRLRTSIPIVTSIFSSRASLEANVLALLIASAQSSAPTTGGEGVMTGGSIAQSPLGRDQGCLSQRWRERGEGECYCEQ